MRITYEKVLEYSDEVYAKYIEAAGLSGETKPTKGIATGSLFLEVDTGDVYAFAEGDNPSWMAISNQALHAANQFTAGMK